MSARRHRPPRDSIDRDRKMIRRARGQVSQHAEDEQGRVIYPFGKYHQDPREFAHILDEWQRWCCREQVMIRKRPSPTRAARN